MSPLSLTVDRFTGPFVSRRMLGALHAATLICCLLASSPALATTIIPGGNLNGTLTQAGSPYVVTGIVTVTTGLTVEPGVVVRFRPATYIGVNATLTTQGTALLPDVFTSDADTLGGAPVAGSWYGVLANNLSVLSLSQTSIRYGGYGGYANLYSFGGPVASLTWNGGESKFSATQGMIVTATSATLTNLLIQGNHGDGIQLTPASPPVLGQIVSNGNTGRAIAILSNPGSFPASLSGSGNGTNGIYLAGNLGGGLANSKWSWPANPNFPYVLGSLTVPASDTLEVGAGTVVKFLDTTARLEMAGAGSLLRTLGTADSTVYFTSIKDDVHGGDTNGDGAATSPAPADWLSILFDNLSSASLAQTQVLYGGGSGYANLNSNGSAIASFNWNGGGSKFSGTHGMVLSTTTVSLSNLVVQGNHGDGIQLTPASPPVLGQIVSNGNTGRAIAILSNPGSFPATLSGSGNGTNGIYLTGSLGGGLANAKWSWPANPNFPYVLATMTVPTTDTLEVGAGAVVKFLNTTARLEMAGAGSLLRTLGTADSTVYFTSIKDDVHGGDTNGDAAATSPAPADWFSILFDNLSSASLTQTQVLYGGGSGFANLNSNGGNIASFNWNGGGSKLSGTHGMVLSTTAVSLSNLLVQANNGDGIQLTPLAPPALAQIVSFGNAGRAIAILANPGSFPGTLSGSGNGTNGIYVTGNLGGGLANARWSWLANANFPYVLGTLTVPTTDTLEVGAGTVVKFLNTAARLEMTGAGSLLHTLGTVSTPVWFTSIKDDARGGDTNGDGGASTPARGDWFSILCDNLSSLSFSQTWAMYGGSSGFSNLNSNGGNMASLIWNGGGSDSSGTHGMALSVTSASLSNLLVQGNNGDGMQLTPVAPPALDHIVARGNTGRAIAILANAGSFPGTFSGSGNGKNCVYLAGTLGGGTANGKWTWQANADLPYLLDQYVVASTDTLVLGAGAVVKFQGAASRLTLNGPGSNLTTLGTGPNPVWLTSFKDDSQGGDTNGDGAVSSPAPGDWLALLFGNGCSATLAQTWIAYGGSNGYSNLYSNGGTTSPFTWNGGGSIQSGTYGANLTTSSFSVTGVRFANNSLAGAHITPGSAGTMTGCDFFGNAGVGSYGLSNASTTFTLDATNSWWGDASGPLDASHGPPDYNPGGLGQQVTDYVSYRPWALAPLTVQPLSSFLLLSPAIGDSLRRDQALLRWSHSTSPLGGPITYDLTLADNPSFLSPIVHVTGLTDTTYDASSLPAYFQTYYWTVTANDTHGGQRVSSPATSYFWSLPGTAGVHAPESPAVPVAFHLSAPAPNPFRSTSSLSFGLPAASAVRLDVFDVEGRLVRTLVDGAMSAGEHLTGWDGRDATGRQVKSGVYFYRLRSDKENAVRRVVLIR